MCRYNLDVLYDLKKLHEQTVNNLKDLINKELDYTSFPKVIIAKYILTFCYFFFIVVPIDTSFMLVYYEHTHVFEIAGVYRCCES